MTSNHGGSRQTVYKASLPRYVKVIGIFLTAYLLYMAGGGFPPWPWKQFFNVLGGGEAPLPFARILLQSLAMLISWLLLLLIGLQMLRPRHNVYSEAMQSPQQDNVSSSSWVPLSSSEEVLKPIAAIPRRTTEKIEQENLLQGDVKKELVHVYSQPISPEKGANRGGQYASSDHQQRTQPEFFTETTAPVGIRDPQIQKQPAQYQHVQDRQQDGRRSAQTFSPPIWERNQLAGQMHTDLLPADNTTPVLVHSRLMLTSQRNAEPVRFEVGDNRCSPVLDEHLHTSQHPTIMLHGAALASLGTHQHLDGKENCLLVVSGVCAAQTPAAPYALFIISDGSVYERRQQTTCRIAIDAMSTHLLNALAEPPSLNPENIKNMLIRSVKHTNNVLYKCNQEENESKIATLTSILVLGSTAYVTSVGDSRTYIYRSRTGLVQISLDHLVRQSKKGLTGQTDIDKHLKETQVYRALGLQEAVLVDTFRVPLEQEDILLLVTNGAWKYVHRTMLAQLLTQSTRPHVDPAVLTTSILHASLEAGGSDNTATIVAHIKEIH